ncbi:tRNA nucleotidyltransferase, CC-adding [hydrothermal vent metagenome]|uniref:tRNA nucleotidyltransferase, CC-adding n=1 Tax=hydrothermal vent metagenome TaxID=652676 RepID=A0A3B0W1N9_9ZZZZ
MQKMTRGGQGLSCAQLADFIGVELLGKLAATHGRFHGEVYLTGGTIRDLLLGREPADIDLTVREDARGWAADLARTTGGAYVPLGRDEDAARVVWQGRSIDFSSFREGAVVIEEDLWKRDITINSLAVPVQGLWSGDGSLRSPAVQVLDPTGGLHDLAGQCVRVTSDRSFLSDPLRLLRAFRFAATHGFAVQRQTFELVGRQRQLISRVAPERVAHELDLIMESPRAHAAFADMAAAGLLFEVLPELKAGVGIKQPASHHLDVFDHCLATLQAMEKLQADPARFFAGFSEVLRDYLESGRRRKQLKWAALFHDLGKPATVAIREDRGGRITFYNHDRAGADLFTAIARRLRWSNVDTTAVADLIAFHMRPFHLCNVRRRGQLSLKACLRLIRLAGPSLPGLFLLGMADTLAGQGPGRPEQIEREVADLFAHLEEVRGEYVEPVHSLPPLLTGRDLIDELHLVPGPKFREILDIVAEARMEKKISSRREALALAMDLLGSGGR